MNKRFAKYPKMAEMLRAMSPDGRRLIQQWHILMTAGLDGYVAKTPKQLKETGGTNRDVSVALEVLHQWQTVMNDVSAIIADPSPADWCCAPGMHAYPDPCPQHPGR